MSLSSKNLSQVARNTLSAASKNKVVVAAAASAASVAIAVPVTHKVTHDIDKKKFEEQLNHLTEVEQEEFAKKVSEIEKRHKDDIKGMQKEINDLCDQFGVPHAF